ncbi:response regulator [Sphingomonas sp. GM_Shp_1]|uniref:response regulator n=1 Tax=Sphingomonas sp. GM_Shp_1 TaxID=2937381 RepID=UPI00226B8660|nr:response regulator [Sphingomonas sp. GM_Shp_1]
MKSSAPTILIVEDQPLLLLHVQFALEDAGYVVIQAASADEALIALQRHPEIQAVFTDVAMPGSLDGAALAARIHQTHPHVAVLVTSGEQSYMPDGLPEGVHFVPKPYAGHDVIRLLTQQLAWSHHAASDWKAMGRPIRYP